MSATVDLAVRELRFTGACLCGAVSFSGTGLRGIVFCHCAQCRRLHGHYAAYAATPRDGFAIDGEASVHWHQSSPRARRGFCRQCSARLFWDAPQAPLLCISAAAIDPRIEQHAICHVFVADKARYYEISDQLPQFPGSMYP